MLKYTQVKRVKIAQDLQKQKGLKNQKVGEKHMLGRLKRAQRYTEVRRFKRAQGPIKEKEYVRKRERYRKENQIFPDTSSFCMYTQQLHIRAYFHKIKCNFLTNLYMARLMSGTDGSCCLGTYTCVATNCMGNITSSAALLGQISGGVSCIIL